MPPVKEYDVAIVGAGPAGAMAAQYAAKGGLSVALLERRADVRIPIRCGEAVGLKGASLSIPIESDWILRSIRTMCMVSPAGRRVSFNLSKKDESYILDRTKMDHDLVLRAQSAGATYYPQTPVFSVIKKSSHQYVCKTAKGDFQSSLIVCADGVESQCAQDLGWDTTLAFEDIETCAFCKVTDKSIDNDTVELYTGSTVAPGGFLWVFPRGDHSANVGLGILGMHSTAGKAKELLDHFIKETYPSGTVYDFHCGGVPVGRWLKPLVKDGALVVGDAARQVNSLNGGGIAYALFAGKVAGETIAQAKQNGTINYKHLRIYQKRWAAFCGKQQLRQYALKSTLLKRNSDTFLNTIAESLSKENPEKLNYLRIFMRTFKRHPLMLLKTLHLFK